MFRSEKFNSAFKNKWKLRSWRGGVTDAMLAEMGRRHPWVKGTGGFNTDESCSHIKSVEKFLPNHRK